jgi:hypothetical protein
MKGVAFWVGYQEKLSTKYELTNPKCQGCPVLSRKNVAGARSNRP